MECAGCGLTRSFVYLAGGDFAASVAIHRVGWMLALATVIQIPYRSYMMRCLKTRGLREPIPRQVNWLMSWTLIVALIGNWLLKLCGI